MGQFRHGNVGIDPYYDARAKIRGDERDSDIRAVEIAKANAASRITDYEPTDINWQSGYDPEGFQRLYDIERIKQEQNQQQQQVEPITAPEAPQVFDPQPELQRKVDEEIAVNTVRQPVEDETKSYFERPSAYIADPLVDQITMAWDQQRAEEEGKVPADLSHLPEKKRARVEEVEDGRQIALLYGKKDRTPEDNINLNNRITNYRKKYAFRKKIGVLVDGRIVKKPITDVQNEVRKLVYPKKKPTDTDVTTGYQYEDKKSEKLGKTRISNFSKHANSKTIMDWREYASSLGIDPDAVTALMGIESNFGTDRRTSVSEAKGMLQVIPSTYAGMKRWFTTQAEIDRLNIDPRLTQIAKSLPDATSPNGKKWTSTPSAQQLMQAGLLRIKYMELVGVDPIDWGAAYNQSAEKVRDNGGPLPIRDGKDIDGDGIPDGTHNADFNDIYQKLYSKSKSHYAGVSTPIDTTVDKAGLVTSGGQTGDEMFDATQTINASEGYITDPNKLTYAQEKAFEDRQLLAHITEIYRSEGLAEEYYNGLLQLKAADEKLYYLEGMRGLRELKGGNAGRATYILRRATQQNYDIRPVVNANGQLTNKFSVYIDGKPQEGLYQKDFNVIQDYVRKQYDAAYLQTTVERTSKWADLTFENELKIKQDAMKVLNEAAKSLAVEKVKLKDFIKNTEPDPDGNSVIYQDPDSGRIFRIYSEPQKRKSEVSGEEYEIQVEEITMPEGSFGSSAFDTGAYVAGLKGA